MIEPSVTFLAGSARVKINPEESVWLGGYAGRTAPASGVISDLYARALVLEETGGLRSVVISIDHLGFGRALVEEVARNLMVRFGFCRERIMIAFSHTHSAPVCDRSVETIYSISSSQWEAAERYGVLMRKRLEEVVGAAVAALEPVRLYYGEGAAGFGVNRRRLQPGCRHFPAPVDQDVPVLKVVSKVGVVKAVLFGYACHATTLGSDKISADYPGFAAEELERIYPEATALFVAGCGADINPLPRRRLELAQQYGHALSAAVEEVVARSSLMELQSPLAAYREEIQLAFDPLPGRLVLEEQANSSAPITRRWAEKWLNAVRAGEAVPDHCIYPIQVWKFGSELIWIALSAEACVDYSLQLKALLGHGTTWVSAYGNELIGYIPSERLRREGGYEGGSSKDVFGLPSPFAAGVKEKIVSCAARLAGYPESPAA